MIQFSVLMSIYEKESPIFLKLALDSIYKSTVLPNEIVVVVDGPITTDLKMVLNQYTGINYLYLKDNCGLSHALNEGLKICKYSYVARMDTDDICHPMRFEKQINYLLKNDKVDILGSYAIRIDENGQNVGVLKVPIGHDEIIKYIWTCPIIHPSVMYRREKILSIGGYDSDAGPRQDDYDLWFRCAIEGACFANLPEFLYYYRFFSNSIQKNNVNVGWSRFKVGFKGCRKLKINSIKPYIGITLPFFRSLMPYPLNFFFNIIMQKFNPRNK